MKVPLWHQSSLYRPSQLKIAQYRALDMWVAGSYFQFQRKDAIDVRCEIIVDGA